MTRGTLILITRTGVLESMEFNGEMMPDSWGKTAVEMLAPVKTEAAFEKMVAVFNTVYHRYDDKDIVFDKEDFYDDPLFVNFGTKYYDRFFSDYLYILNRTEYEIQAIGRDGNPFVIPPDEITATYYGNHIPDLAKEMQG